MSDVLAPMGGHRATVIWLHGIGQDGTTLLPVARRLRLPEAGVRAVFPYAARQFATVSGTLTRAWFDQSVFALDKPLGKISLDALLAMELRLRALLAAEAALVGDASRVLIAGFSQGAAMALVAGLRFPQRVGGLALYAPFMVTDTRGLAGLRSPANAGVPVWIGHGREDLVVPIYSGGVLRNVLRRLGHEVAWHPYPAGHEPFAGATGDLRLFVERAVLGGAATPRS